MLSDLRKAPFSKFQTMYNERPIQVRLNAVFRFLANETIELRQEEIKVKRYFSTLIHLVII